MENASKALLIAGGVLIAIILIANTYAKYTSSSTGTATARVAKWSFNVGKANIATSNTFTFDLFQTIKDSDGESEETDVASANSDKVIAPGTTGSFNIELTNNSEVSAKYGIVYTITNTNSIPVKFSVDGGTTWTDSLAEVVASDTATKLNAKGGTKTITVQWKWDYTGSDTRDTSLGSNGTAKLEVKANVTATQID